MNEEKDWAEFYEQHKDDPDMWGEPEEGPPVARHRLSATVTVRFSPEEVAQMREVARELNVSYSEIVRRAVRKFIQARLTVGEHEQIEHEDVYDYSFSTGGTRTGTLALTGG
jgi:predicted transcriptional regulator